MRCMRRNPERGFTLVEVLVALVIFALSVVGLVGLTGRSLESSRAAHEIREAERLGQALLAELSSRGFSELRAEGLGDATLHDLGRPPADVPEGTAVVGAQEGVFKAFGSLAPIARPEDPTQVDALRVEVLVLWIDRSAAGMPPPAGLRTRDLMPEMVEPDDPEFRPWVGHVRLSSVRLDDAGPS